MGRLIDLTGQKFNHLTVLERDLSYVPKGTDRQARWKCKCDCGNLTIVAGNALRTGKTKSCGCLRTEQCLINAKNKILDITGKRYGRLIALENTHTQWRTSYVWKCQCDCGNIHYAPVDALQKGDVQSCGCLKSIGEEKIKKILSKYKISYIVQYNCEECRFPNTHKKAMFDFYVNNQYFIEFDGIQHYICKKQNWNTEENFQKLQYRDNFKNQWCKEKGIPLIRIPYWALDNLQIEDLKLKTSQFIVKED